VTVVLKNASDAAGSRLIADRIRVALEISGSDTSGSGQLVLLILS